MTVINFTKTTRDIANLHRLPVRLQKEIEGSNMITSHGFQEMLGYLGRKIVWAAGGYWDRNRFYVTSYGSRKYQWDGRVLRTTPVTLETYYE